MNELFKIYLCITAIVFGINFIRFICCLYYKFKYIYHFNINNPRKNFKIKHSVLRLFDKGKVCFVNNAIDLISNNSYQKEFLNAFDSSIGYFRNQMFRSPLWILTFIENLQMYSLFNKKPNKPIAVLCFLLEAFGTYLLGLYLDTSGTGNTILTYLTALGTSLIGHIQ